MNALGGRGVWVGVGLGGCGRGEWMHVYVWLSLKLTPETTTTLLIGYTPIQNKKFFKKMKALDLVKQHVSFNSLRNQQLFWSWSWFFLSYLLYLPFSSFTASQMPFWLISLTYVIFFIESLDFWLKLPYPRPPPHLCKRYLTPFHLICPQLILNKNILSQVWKWQDMFEQLKILSVSFGVEEEGDSENNMEKTVPSGTPRSTESSCNRVEP